LFLELRQHQGGVVVIQTLLFLALVCGVVVNALAEKIVIDQAACAKLLGEFLLLGLRRVDSEFERLVDYHIYNYRTFHVEVKCGFHPAAEDGGFSAALNDKATVSFDFACHPSSSLKTAGSAQDAFAI
jgi:hypothetical protein